MLDDKMKKLKTNIIKMVEQVVDTLEQTFNYYLSKASKYKINDDKIDDYKKKLTAEIINIITRERPFGYNLRFLQAATLIIGDLERIGDLALNIYELKDNKTEIKHHNIYLEKAINHVLLMLEESIKSLVNEDPQLARKVIEDDDEIDEWYAKTFQFYKNLDSKSNIKYNEAVSQVLLVKHIERIADHATNIAEATLFIQEGEINS